MVRSGFFLFFGIFLLAWRIAKGAVKVVRTFARFVVRTIEDLIKGFQELLNFLKKGWEEIKKVIDDVFESLKEARKNKTN